MNGGSSPAETDLYEARPLDASTWDAFAELVERNNGVYGGCWCIGHHAEYQRGVSDPRTLKQELVSAGRAHAALVFDADGLAQGWCQYGSPDELGLKHNREYERTRRHVRAGGSPASSSTSAIAAAASRGPRSGRARPDRSRRRRARRGDLRSTTGREAQGRFLFSATVELFEESGSRGAGRSASTPGS